MKKFGIKKGKFKFNKKTIAIIAGVVALVAIAGIATFASTGDPNQQYVELVTVKDQHNINYSGPTTEIKTVESLGFSCVYSATTSTSTKNNKGVWSAPKVTSTTLDYAKISSNNSSACPKGSSKTTYSSDKKTKTTVVKSLLKDSTTSQGVVESFRPVTKAVKTTAHNLKDGAHNERINDTGLTYLIEGMSEGDNLKLTVSPKDCQPFTKIPVGAKEGQMIPGNKYKITMTYKVPGAERVKVNYPVSRVVEYTVPVKFTKKTYQTGGYYDSRNGQPQAIKDQFSLPSFNTIDNSKDYKVTFSAAYQLPSGTEPVRCKFIMN